MIKKNHSIWNFIRIRVWLIVNIKTINKMIKIHQEIIYFYVGIPNPK